MRGAATDESSGEPSSDPDGVDVFTEADGNPGSLASRNAVAPMADVWLRGGMPGRPHGRRGPPGGASIGRPPHARRCR